MLLAQAGEQRLALRLDLVQCLGLAAVEMQLLHDLWAEQFKRCRSMASMTRSAARGESRDDVGEVGAGRRDPAGGERRRVEAVVDRQDQVLLDGPRRRGRWVKGPCTPP